MSRWIALSSVLWLAICGGMREEWAESAEVSTPTWVRAPDMMQDDEVLGEGPLTWKRDLTLLAPGREETREDRSDIPLSDSESQRKLIALNREVDGLLDAYQTDVTELAERRRQIEDHGCLIWEWVQAIDQQRTDWAAELRPLEGGNACGASVHGPMNPPFLTTRSFRMEPARQEYKRHSIELRAREGREVRAREADRKEELELLIDDKPVRYGRLPAGRYFLYEYAYDWHGNLMDLARRFIDYQSRTDEIRREREPR
jgi:hypothetical protein